MLRKLPQILHSHIRRNIGTTLALHYTTAPLQKSSIITNDCDGGIREIKLNEPHTRNSLSMELMCLLLGELKRNACDETLRCIVLSANGPVFSAGHNLKELAKCEGAKEQMAIFDKLAEIITTIHELPVPVIAKVNGLAAAAGCQLVASCDIVVASEKSQFSTPGANFGIFCSTPGIALTRVIPRLKSSYMLLTGLPITAKDANAAGLCSVVVPEAELDREVDVITESIIRKSRMVIEFGKKFYFQQMGMPMRDAYTAGSKIMATNLALPDGQEGLKSFVEKRPPKWVHKK